MQVIVRRDDGTEVDVTAQARSLWGWLDEVPSWRWDLEELDAALAIGSAAGWPVEHLERTKTACIDEMNRRREMSEKEAARRAYLDTPVEITCAHPVKLEADPLRFTTPGSKHTVRLEECIRLNRAALITRPNHASENDL